MPYALSSVKQSESNGLSLLINYLWIVNRFRIDRFISSPMHCIFMNVILLPLLLSNNNLLLHQLQPEADVIITINIL